MSLDRAINNLKSFNIESELKAVERVSSLVSAFLDFQREAQFNDANKRILEVVKGKDRKSLIHRTFKEGYALNLKESPQSNTLKKVLQELHNCKLISRLYEVSSKTNNRNINPNTTLYRLNLYLDYLNVEDENIKIIIDVLNQPRESLKKTKIEYRKNPNIITFQEYFLKEISKLK